MKRTAIFTLAFILVFVMGTMAQSTVQPRITQAVDGRMVQLKGNTHPLARPEFDRGPAPDGLPAERMLLVLQRGPDQEAALRQLMEDQQTKSSPQYHQWLSPEEFGQRFGPADADIQTITGWLASEGFRVNRVSNGRTVIEFSGTAGQVRRTFHTQISKFVVGGEEHWANASDPQIPAALAPVVRGIVSLHNFRKQPMHSNLGTFKYSSSSGGLVPQTTITTSKGIRYGLGPTDFATIYNVLPLWNATPAVDGTGQTVAIVARSNIRIQDVRDFRNLFGLPANDPVVTLNGPDPGQIPDDESEADLDVQWSGAVAKGATINVVVSESTEIADGVDLSAFYIVDFNVAGILSESFGECEAFLTDNGNAFYQFMWEQAAAQGITVIVSAGDNGSAACDNAFVPAGEAIKGLGVSGLASTGFNVAAGGTDFDDVGTQTQYFSSTNDPTTQASALSYIPEKTWNDSCAATGVSGCVAVTPASVLSGGSGGPSSCATHVSGVCTGRAKPSWQAGTGVPADGVRDIPDVSFFGGGNDSLSFYLVCEADLDPNNASCSLSPQGFGGLGGFVGTSATAPAFAGVMALVQQKMGGRQGNANYVLYPLAAKNPSTCNSSSGPTSNCIFYDTTKGNNSMPCAGGLNCSVTSLTGVLVDPKNPTNPAWLTTPGYDLATGLGTINVANLVTNWNTVSFIGTATTLSLGQSTNIPHGTAVAMNITVAPNSGTAKPTGAVSLLATPGTNEAGIDGFILNSSGATTGATTKFMPGGSYSVFARYGGDGTFGGSDSTPPIPVTVGKESSSIFLHWVTPDQFGNPVYTVNTATYGSDLYLLRADVTNLTDGFQPGPLCSTGCPTGIVTIRDNGVLLDGGTFALNASLGTTEDQNIQLAGGTHSLTATYSGDNSFNASGPANLSVTINRAADIITGILGPAQPVTQNASFTLFSIVETTSHGAAPTGTVTFLDGNTPLTGQFTTVSIPGSATTLPSFQVTLTTSLSVVGNHTITVTYSGDSNYVPFLTTSPPFPQTTVTVTQLGTFALGGSAATAAAGGGAISTITLTPSGGFTGQVAVTCPAATLPPGVTCSPNPLNINVSGSGAATGQLTVNVAAPSAPGTTAELLHTTLTEYASTRGPSSRSGWWKLSAGTGLAAIFLIFVPGRRRYRAAMGLWLVCLLSFAMGCGGGSGGSVNLGPVTTITRITAPAQTKVAPNTALSFSISVSPASAASGMVQLFDGVTAVPGSTVPVVNGAATINNISTLSVGTHQISAHYLGDGSTLPSLSGAVNVTLTGNTTVGIATAPASSNSNVTINLTVN